MNLLGTGSLQAFKDSPSSSLDFCCKSFFPATSICAERQNVLLRGNTASLCNPVSPALETKQCPLWAWLLWWLESIPSLILQGRGQRQMFTLNKTYFQRLQDSWLPGGAEAGLHYQDITWSLKPSHCVSLLWPDSFCWWLWHFTNLTREGKKTEIWLHIFPFKCHTLSEINILLCN